MSSSMKQYLFCELQIEIETLMKKNVNKKFQSGISISKSNSCIKAITIIPGDMKSKLILG